MSESFEIITVECEWDENELRSVRLLFNGKPVHFYHIGGVVANSCADYLAKSVGRWKLEQNKRNVSP